MATQGERIDALETETKALKEAVASLTETVAAGTLQLLDGEPIKVEGFDTRAELLKAFRQIEAIANHINVRLPA
jgi:hypothetical protein